MTNTRRLICLFFLPCVPLTMTACGGDRGPTVDAAVVRDSAGIRIIENHAPVWQEGDEWILDTARVVVMGDEEGEGGQLWRVSGVTRLSDGRIAVLNSGSREVRYFDSAGRLVGRAGGSGDGPGEFRYPMALIRTPGDTLVVLDNSGKRSFFGPGGGLVRELPFRRPPQDQEDPEHFTFDFPLPDGTILGRDRPLESRRTPGPGWFRPTIHIARRDSDSDLVAEYGTYGEIQQEFLDLGQRNGSIVPPFARITSISVGGEGPRIVVGDNDRFELRIYDLTGALLQLVRLAGEQPTVTEAEVEAWKDRQRSSSWVEGQLPQLERGWAKMRVPETRPAFGQQFGISTHGFLWVAEYADPQNSPNSLHIFDPDGTYLGRLRIPDGLPYMAQTVEVGPDYFLATFMDEFEVETVRLYPLITKKK